MISLFYFASAKDGFNCIINQIFPFQYRVESMMLRMAKPMNYIAVSPSVQQRAHQKAPEVIALTLEPESRFYSDPVVVVDFQSLYPSIMIAYNYCYSTCLGKVEHIANAESGEYEFGCTSLRTSQKTLKVRKCIAGTSVLHCLYPDQGTHSINEVPTFKNTSKLIVPLFVGSPRKCVHLACRSGLSQTAHQEGRRAQNGGGYSRHEDHDQENHEGG